MGFVAGSLAEVPLLFYSTQFKVSLSLRAANSAVFQDYLFVRKSVALTDSSTNISLALSYFHIGVITLRLTTGCNCA